MNNFFPKLLNPQKLNQKNELPFTALALSLIQMLLNNLFPDIFYYLRNLEVPLSMIFGQ
jgi:hypothetical protein